MHTLFTFHLNASLRSRLPSILTNLRSRTLYHTFHRLLFGWWNSTIGFRRLQNVDPLFKQIIEPRLRMEIKLVWVRDLGTAMAQGLPFSFPICHCFSFFKTESSPLVADRKKKALSHAVKTWSEHTADIYISMTCFKAVAKHTIFPFVLIFFSRASRLVVLLYFDLHLPVCLPCVQTLYSPIFETLFLLFPTPHLEREKSQTHTVVPLKGSPWKQIALLAGRERTHSRVPSLLQRDPRPWPLTPVQWSRTDALGVALPLSFPPRSSSSSVVQTQAMWVFQHRGLWTAPMLLTCYPLFSYKNHFSIQRSWTAPVVHARAGWLNRGTGCRYKST